MNGPEAHSNMSGNGGAATLWMKVVLLLRYIALSVLSGSLQSSNYSVHWISWTFSLCSSTSSPSHLSLTRKFSDALFYPVSPRSSLQSDTGVITLHLTHLLTARLPSLSPAADLAEPCPPCHRDHSPPKSKTNSRK